MAAVYDELEFDGIYAEVTVASSHDNVVRLEMEDSNYNYIFVPLTADEAARLGSSLLHAGGVAKKVESPVDSPT